MLQRIARRVQRVLHNPKQINQWGRGSINIIDVGAVGELFAPWDRHAFRIRHLLKFEPRSSSVPQPNVTSYDAALWKANEIRTFYVYKGRKGSGSSLFEQNIEYVRKNFETLRQRGRKDLAESWFERGVLDHTEEMPCRTLDSVLAELPARPYHLLKIDAQGAEHPILQGAETLLKTSCLALHLELFTLPLYKGITLLPDVVNFLKPYGFELVKQEPTMSTFDAAQDCLFLKTGVNNSLTRTIRHVYGL
jgi:FkbM family methyltransferase